MSNDTISTGDHVTINTHDGLIRLPKTVDPETVYVVTKTPTGPRGVNYTIDPVGGGTGLRVPGEYLQPATPEDVAMAKEAPRTSVPVLGEVATSATLGAGLFVVTGRSRSRAGHVQVARLGGDGGAYYSSVPAAALTVVPADRITVTN